MGKRTVYLESTFVDNEAAIVGARHYAVLVGNDWFEIETPGGGRKKSTHKIKWTHKYSRRKDFTRSISVAGATERSDQEIDEFNDKWIRKNPDYDATAENCQKYAMDLIQYLIPGSNKQPLPLAQTNAWAGGPGAHAFAEDGYNEARATTGKAGAQWRIVGVEVEGPNAGASANWKPEEGNFGVFAEASVARTEVKVGGVGARVEPNLNTGVGFHDETLSVKALGFGITFGFNGGGLHTPLGSLGLGRF